MYFTVVRFAEYGHVVAVFALRRIPTAGPVVWRSRTVVQQLPTRATTTGGRAVQPSHPTGTGGTRGPSSRAGELFVPLRRARPTREKSARDEVRRRSERILHAGGTGRHHPDGKVHGGQAQRIQRRGGSQKTEL